MHCLINERQQVEENTVRENKRREKRRKRIKKRDDNLMFLVWEKMKRKIRKKEICRMIKAEMYLGFFKLFNRS